MVPELYEKFQDWEGAWVTAQDWLWRREVPAPACDRCGALLEFDGLDTLANVTLNGEVVLRSDNQHVRHAVRVDGAVRFGATNALEVAIASPVAATDRRRAEYPVPLARKPNAYNLFVKKNYASVKNLAPKKRLAAIGKMWKAVQKK